MRRKNHNPKRARSPGEGSPTSLTALVGLGNPGADYARTYHNVGFLALDYLANRYEQRSEVSREGTVLELRSAPVSYLCKPGRYVNRSGGVIQGWCEEFGWDPGELLIVYDDFELDVGRIRLRPSGSSGGHNGLADVLSHLETEDVPRLRIGIGPLPSGQSPEQFVLSPISPDDYDVFILIFRRLPDILETLADEGFQEAMSRWNGVDFREQN